MDARLAIEGASLVLRGAYKAATKIRAGDALRLVGPWLVGPTLALDDDVAGVAQHSAAMGEDVAVVIAGLARLVSIAGASPVTGGDRIVPGQAGRARRAEVADIAAGRGGRFGTAAESKPAGKPFWAQLRGP